MSNAKDSYTYNRKTFENAEFPILCETCLGPNPYIRMQKDTHGGECRICERPFTSFRWMPGRGARFKKTEICQTCAKLKNVCQTCLLDLEYGLPVQVRDHALGIKEELPQTGANRDYYIQGAERALAQTDGTTPGGQLAMITGAANNPLLKKLARNQPYYNRNLPHICSFFVKGECARGDECPYRHEKPTDPDNPLSYQRLRDRYYGVNDPVAEKLLNRANAMPKVSPPEDSTITTLYVGNLGRNDELLVHEADLRDYFYQFGEIRQIHMVPQKCCAFVQYTTREGAELAAERSFDQLILNGQRLKVRWGQPRSQQGQQVRVAGAEHAAPVPNLSNLPSFYQRDVGEAGPSSSKRARFDELPLPPHPPTGLIVPNVPYRQQTASDQPGPSGVSTASKVYYPSQDPQRLGAKGNVVD